MHCFDHKWNCNEMSMDVNRNAVEGPVICVSREEMLQAWNEMKTGKSLGPSEISLKLIAASGGVGNQLMAEICQAVLDGFGMPVEWTFSIVLPICKGEGDIRNRNCCRAQSFLSMG